MTENGCTLLFYHDENGSPIAFSYNGVIYYYIKNLQGDVMKIVNYNGVTIASYSYDVSGKVLSVKNSMGYDVTDSATHIGNISPFRYRGYVYDFETGLYYLQSRYYDPVTTRFINADVYYDTESGSPLSTNMYAYCENNNICFSDQDGEKVKKWIDGQVGVVEWKKTLDFNCYAYAIGQYYNFNPGYFSLYIWGNEKTRKTYFQLYNKNPSVYKIRDLVKNDFKYLKGKITEIKNVNKKPIGKDYMLAIRVTTKNANNYDYHFMRKDSNGVWTFKSGYSGDVFQLRPNKNPYNITWDKYERRWSGYKISKNVYNSTIILLYVSM